MDLGDVGGRRRQAGADSPDRLIGDDQGSRRRAMGQRAGKLAADDRQRLAGVALEMGLADADER